MRVLISDNNKAYGITEYIIDSEGDLETVPKRNVGDICYIAETGEQKMLIQLEGQLQWISCQAEISLLNN